MTAIYSVLHLLVDGVCALAMFGSFLTRKNGYFYILVYNFCAFALQMPFGVLLDMLEQRFAGRKAFSVNFSFLTAAAGVLCTVAGAVTHPGLLGIGNALFHVGGGVGCIRQDNARNWKGRGLGIFVAPGALGLYLGTLLGGQGGWKIWYGAAGAGMAVLCLGAVYILRVSRGRDHRGRGDSTNHCDDEAAYREADGCGKENRTESRGVLRLWSCCLLVVMLRSYIGMGIAFPWKTGVMAGSMAVLTLVFGKIIGGFGAVRFGARKTAVVSLSLAALCYLFSSVMPAGLAAVFLFNMTMPITLYWMVCSMPRMPGFAFGCLTFALFLGFLPGYFGILPQAGGNVTGCAGCIFSLFLLLWGIGRREQ